MTFVLLQALLYRVLDLILTVIVNEFVNFEVLDLSDILDVVVLPPDDLLLFFEKSYSILLWDMSLLHMVSFFYEVDESL